MAVKYWLKMLADVVIWHAKADEVVGSLKPTDYRFSLGATIKSYKARKGSYALCKRKNQF
ncbi:MAG: hypothetical protein ACLUVG_20835 [Phocaeicola vulgatus]